MNDNLLKDSCQYTRQTLKYQHLFACYFLKLSTFFWCQFQNIHLCITNTIKIHSFAAVLVVMLQLNILSVKTYHSNSRHET